MSWLKGAGKEASKKNELQDLKGLVDAFSRSQAMIEFTIDGKIITANQNFLSALGYTRDEVRGQHHSMFVEQSYRNSAEYSQFWDKLGRGEFDANQYKRIGKGGKEIWIQASYNPVLDANGKPCKVVKIATDITAAKSAELAGEHINYRLRTALEVCQTNIMVADENYHIAYTNKTMIEMMQKAEGDLRKDVPALDMRKLIGANIDGFHKNPAHQRRILDGLTSSIETDLKIGGREFHLIVTPILQEGTKKRVGTVVEWKDETEAKIAERAAFRLRSALETCQTNIMVADDSYNIVYLNNTMTDMLRAAESDMRKDVPALDTRKRIGTTVEWRDETAEKAVESEINTVVNAAVAGDFSRRLSLEGKKHFMLALATAMNKVCGNVDEAVKDFMAMFSGLADGDMTKRINAEYQGAFGTLKNDANSMAERISSTISDIMQAAREVSNASAEIS